MIYLMSPRGGTDSFSLATNLETTAPPPLRFWSRTAPGFASTDLHPPLFMEAQGQPLQIVTFDEFIY